MTTIGPPDRARYNTSLAPRFSLRLMLVVVTVLCVLAALHRDRLRVGAQAARAWFEQMFLAKSKTARADRIVMTGSIQPAGAPPLRDPPRVAEVLAALQKNNTAGDLGVNLRIVIEPLATYLDPPRVYPLVGPMQLHHAHYKCTIYSDDDERTVYIDRNHFVGCTP